MWKLVIEDDEGKRTVVPLSREDYSIGRQEGNTIRLTERNVSRQHGRIRKKRAVNGGGVAKDIYLVEDRQSYNGVFVNGLRVAHGQDLNHGDLIQIGDYRIVLQDDATAAVETAQIPITMTDPGTDAKATIPMSTAYRGQTLTDRPNRLVMLVGPTPGVEYPLVDERMNIGRAEDSSISVNHNSVSRLHCEIHALGDGRFEIVDKASSNGVRVNGVELRRSIIEAGDVIELGDVRFKFVGAGQVFVPGPNESQQLTAISDREAELVDPKRRGVGGYLLPMLAAGVLGAAIIVGFVVMLQRKAVPDPIPTNPITTSPDAEQGILNEGKKACTPEDCEAAFAHVNSKLDPKSPLRESPDFKAMATTWADAIMRKAAAEPDPAAKRAMLQRILNEPAVESFRKKMATDQMASIDEPSTTPNQLPIASRDAGTALTSAVVPPPSTRPTTTHTAIAPPPTVTTAAPPSATVPPKPAGPSVVERARDAAKDNRPGEVRSLLEGRVRGGHASLEEARLVKAACKQMGDTGCRDDINSKYPQLSGGGGGAPAP